MPYSAKLTRIHSDEERTCCRPSGDPVVMKMWCGLNPTGDERVLMNYAITFSNCSTRRRASSARFNASAARIYE